MQVLHTDDKIREGSLRWFVLVLRQPIDAPIRRCETMVSEVVINGTGVELLLLVVVVVVMCFSVSFLNLL